MQQKKAFNRGFSLVELIVSIAVFVVVVIAVYNAYASVFSVVKVSRAKIEAVSLINEQLEIVRNLPYADVGIIGGIPNGKLDHDQVIDRGGSSYGVITTVRNVDDQFDGTLGGSPNDLSPADFKVVEIEVDCDLCVNFTPIVVTTRIAPKGLETASTNGALFIKVFDANGNAVTDADVHIENNKINPAIVIDDTTNSNGMLQIVDAPPGVLAYEITVSKEGYSTDKTYGSTLGNPNPTKTHATVALQQVTLVTFSIDKVSTFNVSSVTNTCVPVPAIDFLLKGNKVIGTGPDIYKYTQAQKTSGAGTLVVNNLEWDTYSIDPTDTAYDLVGMNPVSPVTLAPNSSTNMSLIVAPKDPKTLLVIVKDAATGLPLSDVSVNLKKGPFDVTRFTGRGLLTQTDWSGGGGQATSTDTTKYLSSDGNFDTDSPVGDIVLKKIGANYLSSGVLVSSTFDTGSVSNFQKIDWSPSDQPPLSGNPNVRLQIATNNDGGTWDFKGPDGTASSYYTNANKNIHLSNNGNRYIRYKLFLDTANTTVSPNISDVSFTFTSQCTPPGQVSFSGLSTGTYTVDLEKDGYNDQSQSVTVSPDWQVVQITMTPQ